MGSIIISASQMSYCVIDPQSLPQLAWHLTCRLMLRKPSRLCYHRLRWWHAYLRDNIKWAKSMNKSAWKLQVLTERRACLSTSGLTLPFVCLFFILTVSLHLKSTQFVQPATWRNKNTSCFLGLYSIWGRKGGVESNTRFLKNFDSFC